MSCCFGRTFNLHKFLTYNRIYNPRPFSVFTSSNHLSIFRNKDEKYSCRKTHFSKDIQQIRNFSAKELPSIYPKFFDAVTSTEASKFVRDLLIETHELTGLHWWSTIILVTAAMKLCISLPCGVYQQYLISKLKLIDREVADINKKLKEEILLEARRGKWTPRKTQLVFLRKSKEHWKALVVKDNCHPFKCFILSMCQLPVWLLLSLTIRKFSNDVTVGTSDSVLAGLQFQVGGLFWCENLTLPDPTFILPSILTLTALTIVEVNCLSGNKALTLFSKVTVFIIRMFVILSFFIASSVPSCLSLFWAASSGFALLQNLLLLSPKVRRLCRIPQTPLDLDRPYSHIAFNLGKKCASLGRLSHLFSRR